jgi:predicted RND superfamily exporter protein
MSDSSASTLASIFRFIIRIRWVVIAVFAALLGPSVYFALKVPQDNAIDRLIVESDPDRQAARDFEKVFGAAEYVILLAEANDPFDPQVLKRVLDLEATLTGLEGVSANSALSIYRRAKAGFDPLANGGEQTVAFKRFITGSELFRKQGLIGDHFLAIPLVLSVSTSDARHRSIEQIKKLIEPIEKNPAPLSRLRKVGQPFVIAYLDTDTREAGIRYFPVFFLFVIVLCLSLYRSWQALVAFIATLGVSAAMTVGFVGLTGGVFTIVSQVVPMTILIVCTATLVYLHSRFVDHPKEEGRTVDEHQIHALTNKFLACTASIFASAVGFAALYVSKIRPIREMGLWVAVGLVMTWVTVFTLFPALQKVLKTPTQQSRQVAATWWNGVVDFLPFFTYRFRWLLVIGSLVMSGFGAVALFGLPHLLQPMLLETNPVEYIPHDSQMYKDTKELEKVLGGLSVMNLWLPGEVVETGPDGKQVRKKLPPGTMIRPEVLRALNDLQATLAKDPQVGSVTSLDSILRTLRYLGGKGDKLPKDDEALDKISDDLETMLPREPMIQSFVEKNNLNQTHFAVVTSATDYEAFVALTKTLQRHWVEVQSRNPAVKGWEMRAVGLAPLQAKISHHMVPTLVESFIITIAIIFATFLIVFRSGPARIMAMIPSVFAILVMFLFMRVVGIWLNVATILIATTVLGTSENDQIHFFYHFQEGRHAGLSVEQSLKHTLLIAGRAILFATLINAGGFLAFALATLPPIRHFGILSSIAFLLSMIADFTALPAALWLLFRAKPDRLITTAEKK